MSYKFSEIHVRVDRLDKERFNRIVEGMFPKNKSQAFRFLIGIGERYVKNNPNGVSAIIGPPVTPLPQPIPQTIEKKEELPHEKRYRFVIDLNPVVLSEPITLGEFEKQYPEQFFEYFSYRIALKPDS